jgi:AraC-like DNA-binding protein
MGFVYEERQSDSPYVQTITHGYTVGSGTTIRPAECQWHMVVVRYQGESQVFVVGPLTTSGIVGYTEGAEIIWIRFKLGTFMPHLPFRSLRDTQITLPDASGKSFWLKGASWQLPTHENADTFINKMVRDEIIMFDPVVNAVLQEQASASFSPRTVRHRFLQSTGLSQKHIQQHERAQYAAALLRKGTLILDAVYEAGYFDQPHMTRALKQWIGYTPAQLMQNAQTETDNP